MGDVTGATIAARKLIAKGLAAGLLIPLGLSALVLLSPVDATPVVVCALCIPIGLAFDLLVNPGVVLHLRTLALLLGGFSATLLFRSVGALTDPGRPYVLGFAVVVLLASVAYGHRQLTRTPSRHVPVVRPE